MHAMFIPSVRGAGFTLIELMVVVLLLAIVSAWAVPSTVDMIERNTVTSHVNALIGAMALARSEAIRSGTSVVVCASEDTHLAVPSCRGQAADQWEDGWLVFVDRDGDRRYDPTYGDQLLRVQSPLSRLSRVRQNIAGGRKLVFRANGLLSAGASCLSVIPRSQSVQRIRHVVISFLGRPRVLEGATCVV